ncbi:DUF4199 domain-containing protein [Hufsiella ginkgonis]|uniref:DUF4199 family protein n=1 Tax=Hufsiella ginkgonis TaxID=2695274 RepID=A0A7K1XT59_9SPHI|nr:DUF4199 domain-containing protein [Hufsiella ginkgonis]MXV14142.1 DUF4199 family protein [Hufsiella ginkgonis]
MKNAIKYGIGIGIVSGIWLLVMHFAGVLRGDEANTTDRTSWMEYASVLIPLTGLYLGIKNFRDVESGGRMEFFEGIFEGFKIMLVAGVIVAFFSVVYIQYVSTALETNLMGRIAAAGIVGILFNIVMSLVLMNKQRNL